jgi:hypothetical protein
MATGETCLILLRLYISTERLKIIYARPKLIYEIYYFLFKRYLNDIYNFFVQLFFYTNLFITTVFLTTKN